MSRKIFQLRAGKYLEIDQKTLIMGVLNVTPDSFSDGGKYFSYDSAKIQTMKLINDGADIIDIGAESTRPNFVPVSIDEEIARLSKILPLLKEISVPISIDTYKPEVAEFSLKHGADIINDITGFKNPRMIEVVKKFNVPIIAMHNKRNSKGDIIVEIKNFFNRISQQFNFVPIIFDPGIGFGKTQKENLEILQRLDELKVCGGKEIVLLLGVSRKSVIGWATGLRIDDRDEATGAICVHAIRCGINIVRVHNVRMISRMCLMADRLLKGVRK